MTALARVTAVEHLGARLLRITLSDGLVRELDFADALPGVLATIDDDEVFAGVEDDAVAGTISWPNGIDLDPDVLHGDDASASVVQPQVVREYRWQRQAERGRFEPAHGRSRGRCRLECRSVIPSHPTVLDRTRPAEGECAAG